MIEVINFVGGYILQGLGIGLGLCIALPVSAAVEVWLLREEDDR